MGKFQTLQRFSANLGLLCGPLFTLFTCAPELAPLMDFSLSSQAVPGARCKTLDQHRWQNHGHHREGAEASPPLRAGCSADAHLHAHEEGRQDKSSLWHGAASVFVIWCSLVRMGKYLSPSFPVFILLL